MTRGQPCALCDTHKYGKSLIFIDKIRFLDGKEVFTFELPNHSHYICKTCAKRFELTTYNDGRAYIAIEK